MTYHENYFRSPNLKLWWAGWSSTIYDLQRQGWEFSRHENPMDNSFVLALRHEHLRCYGKTYNNEQWSHIYHNMMRRGVLEEKDRGCKPYNVNLAIDYRIDERAYDFQPFHFDWGEIRESNTEMRETKSMADLHIFKPVPKDVNKVLLDDVSLSEVLDIALSKQEPMQEKIRKRMMHDKRMKELYPESEVKAELRLIA